MSDAITEINSELRRVKAVHGTLARAMEQHEATIRTLQVQKYRATRGGRHCLRKRVAALLAEIETPVAVRSLVQALVAEDFPGSHARNYGGIVHAEMRAHPDLFVQRADKTWTLAGVAA